MKRIFIAGAGMVARPLVNYFLERPEFRVELADVAFDKARLIIGGHPRGEALSLDIQDEAALKERIVGADVVISLVPYAFHPILGRICVEAGKPLVTASYISPAMKSLDEEAKRKGVLILNELGLDPGIDHMEAMRIIQAVKNDGGRVIGFVSYCGGLPAPEANTNPFGYKFSWSPKGVLLAGRNPARYLENGRSVLVPAEELFTNPKIISIPGLGDFEGYPNRDSMPYAESYGIPEARTMLRGTLRYPGWCLTMKKIGELGLLDQTERDFSGMTYAGLIRELTHAVPGRDLKKALAQALLVDPDSKIITDIEWLGLLDEKPIPAHQITPLDVLAERMIEKLQYGEGERDMIILRHEFLVSRPDGSTERITSTLMNFGIPHGDSAMSRTVGLPVAIGAKCLLEGKIRIKGVQTPLAPEIYGPILAELKTYGIEFTEKRSDVLASR